MRSVPRGKWLWLLPWAPLVFAAVYVVVVVVNFSSLITAIYMNSDAASAPVIAKLLGSAPHGASVSLGNQPWYEDLWFLRATVGLPGYRALWNAAPAIWSAFGVGVLALSTWSAFGARAAAITLTALVCLGAGGREFLFSFDARSVTVFHTVLLGAVLTWLAARIESLSVSQMALIGAVAGAVSAVPISGDVLFLYWALLPMLLASVVLVWRTRAAAQWRLLAVTVGIACVTFIGGAALRHAAQHAGWLYHKRPVTFATPDHVLSNVGLLGESFMSLGGGQSLGGGEFLSQMTDLHGYATAASGVLVIAALVALMLELARRASRAAAVRAPLDRRTAGRLAYTLFWSFSLLLSILPYVFSTAAVNLFSARYLLAGYVAIGALLPLLAERGRGWQASVVAGVCVFALIASYQIIRQPFMPETYAPGPQEAKRLLAFARAQQIRYGYASYWDAADLTWITSFKLTVYPVKQCLAPAPTICRFQREAISSWYRPRPNTRSLLIVDPRIVASGLTGPDPALGKPLVAKALGQLQVFVYPYDIAERLYGAT